MSMSNRRSDGRWLVLLVAAAALVGCETPPRPFVPKSETPPAVVYCTDASGHKAGAQPWILGGTCCCTPTPELMKKLQADGFCAGMSADDLIALYHKKKIELAGDNHDRCAGLCKAGPHVIYGGHCMAPPIRGTLYYERITLGEGPVAPNPNAPKKKK